MTRLRISRIITSKNTRTPAKFNCFTAIDVSIDSRPSRSKSETISTWNRGLGSAR